MKQDCDGSFESIGWNVGELVQRKQRAYGDSFGRSGECLRQMFPEGIKPDQYDDLLTIARILDKLFRIANNPKAFEENPWQDICGYAILAMKRFDNVKKESSPMPSPFDVTRLAYKFDDKTSNKS